MINVRVSTLAAGLLMVCILSGGAIGLYQSAANSQIEHTSLTTSSPGKCGDTYFYRHRVCKSTQKYSIYYCTMTKGRWRGWKANIELRAVYLLVVRVFSCLTWIRWLIDVFVDILHLVQFAGKTVWSTSERLETKHCIKALYKYSSFSLSFSFDLYYFIIFVRFIL